MVLRRPLILAVDVGFAAAAVTLLLGMFLLAILPLWNDWSALPRWRDDLAAAEEQHHALTLRNNAQTVSAQRLETALAEQGDQPLADVSQFLERMSNECRAAGIELLDVKPLPAEPALGYRQWQAQIRARGSFARFAELLRQLESWSPYVHVRALTVAGGRLKQEAGGRTAEAVCDLSWTVRINTPPVDAVAAGGRP